MFGWGESPLHYGFWALETHTWCLVDTYEYVSITMENPKVGNAHIQANWALSPIPEFLNLKHQQIREQMNTNEKTQQHLPPCFTLSPTLRFSRLSISQFHYAWFNTCCLFFILHQLVGSRCDLVVLGVMAAMRGFLDLYSGFGGYWTGMLCRKLTVKIRRLTSLFVLF